MKRSIIYKLAAAFVAVTFTIGCSRSLGDAAETSQSYPPIYPDYPDCTIPVNIAPLNFRVRGVDGIKSDFKIDGNVILSVLGKKGLIDIPMKEWRKMLETAQGQKIEVEVSTWSNMHPNGIKYKPFDIFVSPDSIDAYVSYRLIEPGYETWKKMGIYQRELCSFAEKAIVENDVNDSGCLNCHSYRNYSPSTMMFHARGKGGGTVMYKDGKLKKINLATTGPKKQGVYPMWHPAGRYIAFSSNDTHQTFFGRKGNPIEVYDISSDLIIYDTETDSVITDPRFSETSRWETFPAWSPDGKYLYFCSADSCGMPLGRKDLHYDLLRVGFDASTGRMGETVDTIRSSALEGGSVSFPRISPDGKYLMYTLAENATFPIWHKEADLEVIRLSDNEIIDASLINSPECESYHSWSSSGRWVIFSSRRLDGRYTRLFIAHMDKDGEFGKPFLLPQSDPEHNMLRMKSYNIPELMRGEVKIEKSKLKDLFNDK